MIKFDGFKDGRGIKYVNTFNETKTVRVEIKDKFTGLLFHNEVIELAPNVNYWTIHGHNINNQIFSIYNYDTNELYFSIILNDSFEKINLPSFYEDFILKVPDKFKSNIEFCGNIFEINLHNTYSFGECIVEKDDIVFDVGAFCGFFSKYAIDQGASKVYFFEPNPEGVNLGKCFFPNHNIIFENVAVSKNNGFDTIMFSDNNDILGNPLYGTDIFVRTINLMDYIKENSIEKIDYLKIDIEGFEYEVFESLDEDFLTKNVKKIAMEYHDNDNYQVDKIIDKLTKCNFEYQFEFEYELARSSSLGMLYAWKK
jgi:FkbM family methyltransferase